MKEGRGGVIVPFAPIADRSQGINTVSEQGNALPRETPQANADAAFYKHVLDAQMMAGRSSGNAVEALRTFVYALIDGAVAEPFAGIARSVFLSFVDTDRFPLRDDLNAIVSSLTEGERETLLNGFWHRAELVQLLTPARIATLALKRAL